MAYVDGNPQSKKQLKEWLASGKTCYVFQPNSDITGATLPDNGVVYLEGPHYPKPHRWYARGTVSNGRLIKIQ